MEASRLLLETYHLTRLSIEPADEGHVTPLGQFADFGNAEFKSEVTFHDLDENGEHRDGLELRLIVEPKDGEVFPYRIDVSIVGIFNGESLPEDKRESLVLVNGSSMLYGALRELLLGLSHRFVNGPVMLPSVHFVRLATEYEAEKKAKTEAGAATADH